MKVQIENKPLSPNLDLYREKFGHLPPGHLFRAKTLTQLDEIAELALFKGKAVKEWENWSDKNLPNFSSR
jgi:hypothetical protein